MRNSNKESPHGVLHEDYAQGRLRKKELRFRLMVRARLVVDAIRRFLGRQDRLNILDIGAADGLTMLEMSRLLPSCRFTGLEYSEALIREAPALPDNISLKQGDVSCIDPALKQAGFDVVCALALLEHLPDPERAVFEAFLALKPGGLFVATSPNPFWDRVSTKFGLLSAGQHEAEMTKGRMMACAEAAGLNKVVFERFMWSPVSVMPYFGVDVSAEVSLRLDAAVRRARVFDWMFVNQALVARKPAS